MGKLQDRGKRLARGSMIMQHTYSPLMKLNIAIYSMRLAMLQRVNTIGKLKEGKEESSYKV